MSTLSPYDTGARCEARPWIPYGTEVDAAFPKENFGKVDFDDDAGETVMVTYLEREEDGRFVLHVIPMCDETEAAVVWHRGDGTAWRFQESSQTTDEGNRR